MYKIFSVNRFCVLFLISISIMSCTHYEYRYRVFDKNEYGLIASVDVMRDIANHKNLNECYHKDRCEDFVRLLIDKVVKEQMIPKNLCLQGYNLQTNSIMYDENSRVYATYKCNE